MRETVRERVGAEEECSYLPGERSRMHYRMLRRCAPDEYQQLLERGWRRFGGLYFRPGCRACAECRSLRVEVASFRPNRSMRRTWRRNQDLQVVTRRPTISGDHLALYERYHADMARRRGWKEMGIDPLDYFLTFVDGHHEFGYEVLFVAGTRLLCVSLVDVLPDAISAVYCYYEPAERSRSLGVYSILHQIRMARARGLTHVYLGFWVAGNESMAYKINYRPNQILRGRPESGEEPEWVPTGAGAQS